MEHEKLKKIKEKIENQRVLPLSLKYISSEVKLQDNQRKMEDEVEDAAVNLPYSIYVSDPKIVDSSEEDLAEKSSLQLQYNSSDPSTYLDQTISDSMYIVLEFC